MVGCSMSALAIENTMLEQLDLNSLRSVVYGKIIIAYNIQLCYGNTEKYWRALIGNNNNTESAESRVVVMGNMDQVGCGTCSVTRVLFNSIN